MGETRVEVVIAAGRKRKAVNLLADTGATLTVITERILRSLKIRKIEEVEVELGDGRVVRRSIGEARVMLNGKGVTTRVIFGKRNDAQVLGTVVLEELGLAVDPIRRRLVPVRYLLISSIYGGTNR
jgi:clan AA aspartic protease